MDNNKHLTFEHLFTDQLKDAYSKKPGPVRRIYAIMTFNTEFELGLSNKPYEWVNSSNKITLNGAEALILYRNSLSPMTKLVDGESFEELNNNMVKMVNNFKNPKYVTRELEYYY